MNIKLGKTNKSISSLGGLTIANELLKSTRFEQRVRFHLPSLVSGQGRSFTKLKNLVMGSIAGAECIDDMARLHRDDGFQAICQLRSYTPKSYGDFLRSFESKHLSGLSLSLRKQAFDLRSALKPDEKNFFFDIDSTSNIQYGEKMEGVCKSYKNVDCLDTLNIFDEFGLQYHLEVRAGNTHTATGSEQAIHDVMGEFHHRKEKGMHACVRADRGYYRSSFINTCLSSKADVLVGIKQDETHFAQMVGQIQNWEKSGLKWHDGRELEIGYTSYRPKNVIRNLRVVVIRALQPTEPLYPNFKDYDYFGVATTLEKSLHSNEEIILKYRKRGQAENFIKENKNGFDLRHYPCQKLSANKAYGLIYALAYNYMRFIALADPQKRNFFAKNIRFHWIHLPSLIARTGREIVLKYKSIDYKEVSRWFELIHNHQQVFV